ncbi:MAG: helix-turn-helix domain-containing protein [Rikenellaceae bacterium]|nr:helix-turn-helix domain-containing protein [Rikenellaceae bacterium]
MIEIKNILDDLSNINTPKPLRLCGEYYLTSAELSEKLRITKRTLFRYIELGYLPYYMVSGKALFKESEIEEILLNDYRKK